MSHAVLPFRRPVAANAALDASLAPGERDGMIAVATQKIDELFDILQIDHRHDQNTRDTPRRVARMYVEELLAGRFDAPPAITAFGNELQYEGLIVTGPIALRSVCAHHLMPIYGCAIIGVLPAVDGKIIGLSKYDRIVEHFSARFQIQEELVRQIGDFIMAKTAPRGLSVRISAVHMCKTHRGVFASHQSRMVTTMHLGAMQTDAAARAEFLQERASLDRGATP